MTTGRNGWTPILGIALAATIAAGQCEPGVHGTARYEYDPGTGVLPLPIQALTAILEQCGAVGIEWMGIDVNLLDFTHGSSRASFDIQYDAMGVLNDTIMSMGDLWPLVTPEIVIENCPPFRGERPILRMGGYLDLYAFHVGSGGYFRETAEGTLTACDTVRVYSPIATTLEVTARIHGSVTVAESFGQQPTTSAIGRLELQGFMAGSLIGPYSLELESTSVIPHQASIDETLTIEIEVGPGTTDFGFEVTGSFFASVGAKGTGFFGSLAGSSTAVIDFPDTIKIGNFRGQGGGPLPQGVVVQSLLNGMEYSAGTSVCPADCDGNGTLNLDDIDCFIAAFIGADLSADCDGNAMLNLDDIDCFIASFLAGCP